jgi:RNA polymerase sigma-70 factor (ECF subfamily)
VIPPTEVELLCRAQAGDMTAFQELLERLESAVRRFIWRLIGSHEATDDIVQDVFIALYKNLKRIRPADKLRPYLFRMVRNRCWDELRRQGRFEVNSLDDEPVEAYASLHSEPTGQPEEIAHWLLLYLEVQEAMNHLPELQRQALILYSEEGLSYQEIASAMNTSIGTIKSRLYHAKQTLRRLLNPDTLQALDSELVVRDKQHVTSGKSQVARDEG